MNTDLYRLVYCSRNRIRGIDAAVAAELKSILASSRKNNAPLGITGALLYNAGSFAQVLEGPLQAVERVFEVIQRDPRHSEVVVVESGPTTERSFPAWSMAFSGSKSAEEMPQATAAFDAVFQNTVGAGEHILSILRELVLAEDDWILLEAA